MNCVHFALPFVNVKCKGIYYRHVNELTIYLRRMLFFFFSNVLYKYLDHVCFYIKHVLFKFRLYS